MPILGMVGTESWQVYDRETATWLAGTGQSRPLHWREGILYLFPNGDVPLTGLTSKMKSEKVTDPEFNWFTEILPEQGGAITGVWTDAAMTVAYVGGGLEGDPLYFQVGQTTAEYFRAGHIALLRYSDDPYLDVVSKVTSVIVNGVNSQIAVRLLEDDDNSLTPGNDLQLADRILIAGNVNPEGGAMPAAITTQPDKLYNYTQIFRTPLEITRTAQKTKLRTGDAYNEQKVKALRLHGMEMEKAFLWGIKTENTGANAQPERTTMGLVPFIRQFGGVVSDFVLDPLVPAGTNWLDSADGGGVWFDRQLAEIFKYGGRTRMAFCGYRALLALNHYIRNHSSTHHAITESTTVWGIQVTKWITPFGEVMIYTHPLLSYEPTNGRTMIIFDPDQLRYKFVDDTTFYPDDPMKNTGHGRIDGRKEEFLTECGLEMHHPTMCGYLTSFGEDKP